MATDVNHRHFARAMADATRPCTAIRVHRIAHRQPIHDIGIRLFNFFEIADSGSEQASIEATRRTCTTRRRLITYSSSSYAMKHQTEPCLIRNSPVLFIHLDNKNSILLLKFRNGCIGASKADGGTLQYVSISVI